MAAAAETIDVAAGQTATVGLRLGASPVARKPDRKPLPQTPERGVPTWIGWVATGALAAGAGVTGALALASSSELEETPYAGPERRPPPDSEVSALQDRVDALYRTPEEWSRKAVLNTVGMGPFSSDRSVREYAERIWNIRPVI